MTTRHHPFLEDRVFDAEATRVMGEAYDKARAGLHDKGQPHLVQEIIAKRVVDMRRPASAIPMNSLDASWRWDLMENALSRSRGPRRPPEPHPCCRSRSTRSFRPPCAHSGAKTWLILYKPARDPDRALLAFECRICEIIAIKVVQNNCTYGPTAGS